MKPWTYAGVLLAAPLLGGCEKSQSAQPPIEEKAPPKTEIATFSLGWFWEPDSQFGSLPGVVRTRVGYTGGTKKNPTYVSLGDHTETFQLYFDPQAISYERLLGIFWSYPNSCAASGSRQYMSAIFYANDEQKKLAVASREREEKKRKTRIATPILPLGQFYLAEDYHQKYRLRNTRELMREFAAMFPNDKDFVNSTAAARVNGYLGGNGKVEDLEKEIDSYGLSDSAQKKLLDLVKLNR